MTVEEAWKVVESKVSDMEPEIICEFDNYYSFALRPAGSKPGIAAGAWSLLVNKTTHKLEKEVSYPGDPRTDKSTYWKIIDPSELKRAS